MSTIENIVNEEMVQDVVETVVEVKPSGSTIKNLVEGGLYALAGVVIWEGGKFIVKKVKESIEAKKDTANVIESDFEDVDAE
jgi:hypothetical protein